MRYFVKVDGQDDVVGPFDSRSDAEKHCLSIPKPLGPYMYGRDIQKKHSQQSGSYTWVLEENDLTAEQRQVFLLDEIRMLHDKIHSLVTQISTDDPFPSMDDRENWNSEEQAIFNTISFTLHAGCEDFESTAKRAMRLFKRRMWVKYGILRLTEILGSKAPFTDFN